MGSTSVLVIGTSFAGTTSWTSPETLGLLISGVVGLAIAAVYESFRKEDALIPAGVLRNLNVINMLVISILHNFAFTAGTYFIPLYYQALHGTSPLVAGMQVLPFSLGAALATIPTARFISLRPGHQWIDLALKIAIVSALALSAIGYGTFKFRYRNFPIYLPAHHLMALHFEFVFELPPHSFPPTFPSVRPPTRHSEYRKANQVLVLTQPLRSHDHSQRALWHCRTRNISAYRRRRNRRPLPYSIPSRHKFPTS